MATKAPAIVRGSDGRLGTIIDREGPTSEGPDATRDVLFEDGRLIAIPFRLLELRHDGSYALAASIEEIERSAEAHDAAAIVVPVMAEEVEFGKRKVETGRVRVRKTVRTVEKVVDEPLAREEVEVVRVPINRVISEPVGPRQEGDTLIVPLLEEILVVEKRLVLKEEIRITRRRSEHRDSQSVTLRSEEAVIERVAAERATPPGGEG